MDVGPPTPRFSPPWILFCLLAESSGPRRLLRWPVPPNHTLWRNAHRPAPFTFHALSPDAFRAPPRFPQKLRTPDSWSRPLTLSRTPTAYAAPSLRQLGSASSRLIHPLRLGPRGLRISIVGILPLPCPGQTLYWLRCASSWKARGPRSDPQHYTCQCYGDPFSVRRQTRRAPVIGPCV